MVWIEVKHEQLPLDGKTGSHYFAGLGSGWFLFFFPLYIRGICNICISNMVSTLLSHAIPSLSGDLKLVNEANHVKSPLENTGTTEIMFTGKLNWKT